MQPCHPPLVLVFDVTVSAVTNDDNRDGVASGYQVLGDVILTRQP